MQHLCNELEGELWPRAVLEVTNAVAAQQEQSPEAGSKIWTRNKTTSVVKWGPC